MAFYNNEKVKHLYNLNFLMAFYNMKKLHIYLCATVNLKLKNLIFA